MRILVTGAAGFIGSHVTRRIAQEGHEIWAVLLPGESTERLTDLLDCINVVRADLRAQAAVRDLVSSAKPQGAIHLAWYAAAGKYWTSGENVGCAAMSLSLAQALAEAGCSRLVAAGTCAEYDWDYGFLSEDVTPLKPRTLYGVSKNATRQILQAFCNSVSMGFAWTRFFYIYGPGEAKERLVPSVILALLSGQTARCTEGTQMRDFLHVEDVASAVWAVAQSDLQGPVNIGSGQPVKVRAIAETIAKLVGGDGALALGALPTDPHDPFLLVPDVRKLRRHTGWTPSLPLDEGMRRTIAWWRERLERKVSEA